MSAFDILVVAQKGRLEYEAALFAASLREMSPGFSGRLYVAEPQPGPLWPEDPRISDEVRALLARLDATPLPFEASHFGATYPHGNKVEAMAALPDERPCVFFDSDSLVLGEIGALRPEGPTASMRRSNTWPVDVTYGPEPEAIWRELYARFGVAFEPTLDGATSPHDWRRFLYFNAGLIVAPAPRAFAERLARIMLAIRDDPPPCQPLDPWLDQIALPIAVAEAGGGRPEGDAVRLDGELVRHWRQMPLFFAIAPDDEIETLNRIAAPNRVKKVLKQHEPFRRFIFQGAGPRTRALFDRDRLPPVERVIRQRLKRNGLWIV